ncbi:MULTISPECIES: PilN domain-containing protein [Methylophaga]|jgi:type IV pilus assembly protein PilN|uniref:PilN domain-containing protein n=1 Tax=Methylophaga marina TaxID=45495 RepID=A0ABP3DJX7_9GAMM|nr:MULTISPECIES: PilN domain-containing protein [Methylophaga]BDZ74059.1 pilus assembly protein PilN [Methylophaga marina]|tara:strand:- start:5720 stop:6280 length:561 start_codon:yes stop_codon:yes gene_type:complete
MAHINLLPWREERREERQKQFYLAMGATFLFAALIFYLVMSYADSLISEQNQRNTLLQTEIAKLDIKIKEIQDLEQQKKRLLARMQVIQDLQESRPKVVKVFDSIARVVPEGIHLEKVVRTGNTITFSGTAESNARVSVFMRQLDENPEYGESRLQVIKRTSSNNNAIRQFTVEVNESTDATQEDK